MVSLLKLGMSYIDILGLTESELTYILAAMTALNEKEQRDAERKNRR